MKMEKLTLLAGFLSATLCLVSCGYCPEGEPANPQDVRAKGRDVSIFSDLTVEEMDGVLDYMYQRSGLRIASWARGTLNDSYIYVVEALPPRKEEALRYLDDNGPKPKRYAKVILYRGDASPQDIQELKVGPLPEPEGHEVIKYSYYKDPIPYHNRNPLADHELRMWESFMRKDIGRLDPILKPATGGYSFAKNCGDKCLAWFPNTPGKWTSGTHMMWVNFYKSLDAYYLHPVGLQVRVDAGSTDISQWKIDFVWWRGTSFDSIDAILRENQQNRVPNEVIADPPNAHEPTLYSSLNFRGEPQPKKPQRGPKSYYPDGRRYKVEDNHISWQGWEFDFGVKTIMGMHVDDIRFRGDRVVYELAVQELGAFYSGASPLSMHTSFFDTIVFIGREIYSLQKGVDCPEHATYFDHVHYLEGKAFVFENSVCVFEQDMGIPLRRHYESDHKGGFQWVHGMQDNALILRSMVVAYNYEYLNDVIFHQHGGIETKLTLSGYILPTFNPGNSDPSRGFEVFPNGIGNIHHHLANFKVDLDIKGTRNRFETYDIKQEKFEDMVDVGEHIYGNKFERNLRKFELDAQLTPGPNQHLIVMNNDETNMFGNAKGYRVQVLHGSSILHGPDFRMRKAAACFKFPVAVTKRKDEEFSSTATYASADPFDPVMSFESFYNDNESIVDEDLVLWINLGTVHIPHTEDIPIVTTQNTQLTFHLTPYNYFDEDPSLASRDNIRVERSADGEAEYKYSGVPDQVYCVPRNSASTTAMNVSKTMIVLVSIFVLALTTRV